MSVCLDLALRVPFDGLFRPAVAYVTSHISSAAVRAQWTFLFSAQSMLLHSVNPVSEAEAEDSDIISLRTRLMYPP